MRKQKAILRPLLLATVLTAGFGVVWGVIALICSAEMIRPKRTITSGTVVVRDDGTPIIRSAVVSLVSGSEQVSYRTLEGERISGPVDKFPRIILHGPPKPRVPLKRLGAMHRGKWDLADFSDGGTPPVYWYFIADYESWTSYTVGYSTESKLRVGYIGLKGFRPDKPPPDERFPIDGRQLEVTGPRDETGSWQLPLGVIHRLNGDRLLEINLRERTVRTVLEYEGLISAQISYIEGVTRFLVVRERDGIVFFGPDGEQRLAFKLPAELRDSNLDVWELDEHTMMARLWHKMRYPQIHRQTLFWINRRGDILRRRKVETGEVSFFESERFHIYQFSASVPAPTIVTWIAARKYRGGLGMALAEAWPALLGVTVVSIGLAWMCYRRQKKYGRPWTWVWVGFVLLFGAPAWFGYLFHCRWPVREPCPTCGKPAPRDRESCFACGEPFPAPAPKGIEVLA